jgi:beta-ureidopropionase
MSGVVRAALVQQKWTGDKDSMVENAVAALREAASRGAQVACLQELFSGPYFCQVQDAQWYSWAEEVPDGPTIRLMQAVARDHHMRQRLGELGLVGLSWADGDSG